MDIQFHLKYVTNLVYYKPLEIVYDVINAKWSSSISATLTKKYIHIFLEFGQDFLWKHSSWENLNPY